MYSSNPVTGFDNITLAEFSCPSLTTIHVPRARIGHMMLECLIPGDPRLVLPDGRGYVIDPELIVRESTGPARIWQPEPNVPEVQACV